MVNCFVSPFWGGYYLSLPLLISTYEYLGGYPSTCLSYFFPHRFLVSGFLELGMWDVGCGIEGVVYEGGMEGGT